MSYSKTTPSEISSELLRLIGRMRKDHTITTDEIDWLIQSLLRTLADNTDLDGRLGFSERKLAELEAELAKFKGGPGTLCCDLDGRKHLLTGFGVAFSSDPARAVYHKEGE